MCKFLDSILQKLNIYAGIDIDSIDKRNNIHRLISLLLSSEAKVEDEHRYNLEVSKDQNEVNIGFISLENNNTATRPINRTGYKNIVLLLESPHKDEFAYFNLDVPVTVEEVENGANVDRVCGIKPANGATGDSIRKYLFEIIVYYLNLHKRNCKYQIFIVNPIPYQTSLWTIHKQALDYNNPKIVDLRDEVWKQLWTTIPEIEAKFLQRLNDYQPTYIINCCTKTISNKIIKPFLRNYKSNHKNTQIKNGSHPSSWSRGVKYRKLKRL